MLMNAGLFVLVWESVTVSVAAIVRVFFPSFALYEMLMQAVLLLPVAFFITTWIDQHFLSAADAALNVSHGEPDEQPTEVTEKSLAQQRLGQVPL